MSNTIKNDKICLEQLLNSLSPVTTDTGQDAVATAVDNNAAAPIESEPIFTFDTKAEMKAMKKKARKTIQLMAEHILPDELLGEEYIQNKIDQDVETLADLYWQVRSNTLMQNALLETVSRGNTMPRNFEVFAGLTEKISNINKQIQVTEATMRKTYLDLKFEIRDKEAEVMQFGGSLKGKDDNKQLPEHNSNIITGGGKLAELLMYKKMKEMEMAQDAQIIVDEQ